MNSVIISKSFPHAFDQQHFPRKGSRSCTGVPWCSALCCLQGKKQDKTNNRNPTVPTLYLCSNSRKCDKSSRSGVWGKKVGAVSVVHHCLSVGEGTAWSVLVRLMNGPSATVLSKLTSKFIQGLQYKHNTQLCGLLITCGLC